MKTVREIMKSRLNREVYTVVPEQSVLSAAQLMWSKNVGALVVTRDHDVIRLVSERDMLKNVLRPGLDPRDVFISQIMSRHIMTVSPDETWEDCLSKMKTRVADIFQFSKTGIDRDDFTARDLGIDEAEILDRYMWDPYVRRQETEVESAS